MTEVPRVLTIQDMSSIGRCALTVMIPIISAMRCQAVPLATAVLSNHLEYPHYEFVDLSAHMRDFMDCWDKKRNRLSRHCKWFFSIPRTNSSRGRSHRSLR